MGKVVRTLILGGVLVAAAFFALDAHDKQVTDLEYELQLSSLRNEYVERAGWVRSIPAVERWRDEFVSLNRWYEAQWTALHNRFPGRGTPESVLARIEAEEAAGARDGALKREFFEHTRGFHKLLSSGHYLPVAHHVASGVRIDLLDMKKVTYEGRNALRVDAVIWGAPRQQLVGKVDGQASYRKMALDFNLSALSLEFVDEKDKLLGGGDTDGPVILVDYPERWIPAFPPQAALATWWIEPIPNETKHVLMKINGDIRSSAGGSFPVNIDWKLPASDAWKLGAGQAFEGEERLMPEEAMDRK